MLQYFQFFAEFIAKQLIRNNNDTDEYLEEEGSFIDMFYIFLRLNKGDFIMEILDKVIFSFGN